MNRTEWQQVKDLFDTALKLAPDERERFLDENCAENNVLRREVENLLASFKDDSFLEQSAAQEFASLIVKGNNLECGRTIAHYEILSQIGAGGMGEVYLANDKKLDRKVAVKFLNEKFSRHESNLKRFIKEAKAASALNHPNILVVHEIGESEDAHCIVSEFVEGKTLREIFKESPLKLSEVLDFSIQIANALVAAHTAYIIHRDIKPENIIVRPDGYVKILDFGLAKLIEQEVIGFEDETVRQNETAKGIILGTVNYMSPEQAKGERVDERTDIFSLGVLLYEMTAGRTPFAGDSMSETFANLINSEPQPLSRFAANVPDELQQIIFKMLRKNKDERYQTMKDLLADLKDLRENPAFDERLEKSHSPDAENATKILQATTGDDSAERTKNRLHLVSPAKCENALLVRLKINKMLRLSAAICAAVLLFGAFFLWQKWRTDSRFKKIELKALTTSGEIRNAAISPDGKLLAYAKNESGRQSLWISQTQFRESEMRLTEPTAEATFAGLSFTPDGNKIYFLLALKNNSVKQLAAISTLGGQPTVILDDVDSAPAFSPDGRRFAFMRGNSKTGVTTLFTANADGSDLRELARREPPINFKLPPLAWSPDGKKIACAVFDRNLLSSVRIVEINAETGAENIICDQTWDDVHAISWTKDEAGLIFTASEPQKSLSSQIWFLPYANRTARRLTNDLVSYGNLSVARDSGEIIIRQLQRENQVWLLDAKLPSATPRRITPNNSDGEHGLAWTPDNRLIYSSAINGSNGLQKMSIQDSSVTPLTTAKYVISQPCATADGRYVVYVSAQAGHYYLWRVDADGKNIKQLTSDNIEHPTCSPADASRVFYTTATDGKISLREISIDGGESRSVSEKTIVFPQISPDGNRIACFYRADAKAAWQIAIMPTDEDRVSQTFDLPKTVRLNLPFVWSKDGNGLILIDARDGIANLWRYSLNGQAPVQITNFADGSLPNINYLAVSSDGSQIALTRMRTISDIVQIDDK